MRVVRAIVGIFWSFGQRRLRAGWRLLFAYLALMVLMAVQEIMSWRMSGGNLAHRSLWPDIGFVLALVAVLWVIGRFVDRRPFRGFGLHVDRAWWVDFGFGLALGALLMALVFAIELAVGWVTVTGTFVATDPGQSFWAAILYPIAFLIIVGFWEELYFRGYVLTNMAEGMNWRRLGPRIAVGIAWLGSALVFGVLHAGNPNASLVSTINIFLAGILLALGFVLTGELAIPIGLHITWNFVQSSVFGFATSGIGGFGATVVAIEQAGPDLWTGGVFGPEAGLLGVGAMAAGCALIVGWVRWRRGGAGVHVAIAEPPVRGKRERDGEEVLAAGE